MKNSKAFTLIEVIIVAVIILLLVGITIPAFTHAKKQSDRQDRVERQAVAAETECAHKWLRWSAPVTASNWWTGTQQYQSRTCEKCGLAETRVTQTAAGAQ